MPIGILKFKLPEEREEFELSQQAGALSCVLSELDNWLRAASKYQNLDTIPINEVRDKIRELEEQYEVKKF